MELKFSNCLAGFCKIHYTYRALLKIIDSCKYKPNNELSFKVIFMDLSKAF